MNVKCCICGKELELITNSHLKIHRLSFKEYRALYPNSKLISEEYSSKLKKSLYDHPTSQETRIKISLALKDKPKSKRHCLNLSKALLHHPTSQEARLKWC